MAAKPNGERPRRRPGLTPGMVVFWLSLLALGALLFYLPQAMSEVSVLVG